MESGWGEEEVFWAEGSAPQNITCSGTGRSQADQVYSGSWGRRDRQAPGHEVFLDHCFQTAVVTSI